MTRGIVVDPTPSPVKTGTPAADPAPAAPQPDPALPEKFKGKSAKEIADSYSQLESELGRIRNELGDTRAEARTWRSMAEQVTATRPAQTKKTPVEITPDRLITAPTDSVRAVVDDVLEDALAPVRESQQKLTMSVQAAEFARDFPDYAKTGNDPEFQAFISKSQRRVGLARAVLERNDLTAARALMEDWEERRALVDSLKPVTQVDPAAQPAQAAPSAPTGVQGARAVATERTGSTAVIPTGKVWNKTDVVDTMLRNPDKYYSSAYQADLMQAIKDGRLR